MNKLTPAEKNLLANVILDAKRICNESLHDIECSVAWDVVDEVARGIHHRVELRNEDPLELYCTEFPENDECRIYDI